jgi:hypothetical protein
MKLEQSGAAAGTAPGPSRSRSPPRRDTSMCGGQVMEPGDAPGALGQPGAGQPPSLLILEVHVVRGFRQSTPAKINPASSTARKCPVSRRAPGGRLIVQRSPARHPTSRHGDLASQPGHDLALELSTQLTAVLTGWRLSDHPRRTKQAGRSIPISSWSCQQHAVPWLCGQARETTWAAATETRARSNPLTHSHWWGCTHMSRSGLVASGPRSAAADPRRG